MPVDEEDFDAEVSDFRRHLENQYKLCDECELLIAKILDSKEPKDVKKKNNRMNLNNTCLFVNKVDKVSSLILPSIANFFILSSLTYLFSVSFHAGNLNDGQFIFAPFFTPDHVYIYQKYYFHLIFTGLALFLTQAYLRSYNRFFIDITQLVLWITLLLNSSKVNAFSLTDDGLVDCQQCLLAISTLTTLANVILMFSDYFRGYRKMPVSVQLRENSLESKKPKPVSQAKPRMENVDTNHIRKQIKDLSLDDSDTSSISSSETSSLFSPNKSLQFEGVFRRTLPTYSFTANRNPLSFGFKPNELPLKFPSLEQNAFAYKESNFSYYYNFSNANIISSFVAPKPFYRKLSIRSLFLANISILDQSFIDNRHSPRNNRSPSPRTLDYSNCGEAQPKLNRNPSTPSLFVTFLHTFELTLFLIIILLLIVILSMPISLSLQSDFNNINLQILVSNISNP